MDEIKFLNYVGHLLQRNGKRVKIFIAQRTLCTDGRHRCDKSVKDIRVRRLLEFGGFGIE